MSMHPPPFDPNAFDTLTFWALVGAGWLAGIVFIGLWLARQVLREWWDFKLWYRTERKRLGVD